jgi:hypothetical protein
LRIELVAYSAIGPRSLVVIDARRALITTNDMVSLRPFVILAIRMMGPGRRRVEMVKLVHDMHDARGEARPFIGRLQVAAGRLPQALPSEQRAA